MSKKKQDPLAKFIEKKKAPTKSVYTMVKFNNAPKLLEHMLMRCDQLELDKQNYILALIRQDMEGQNGKK